MTLTTIKVTTALRDRLKEQAQAHGRTLGDHLQSLADDEARRERFRDLQRAMTTHAPDDAYLDEARDWAGEAWS